MLLVLLLNLCRFVLQILGQVHRFIGAGNIAVLQRKNILKQSILTIVQAVNDPLLGNVRGRLIHTKLAAGIIAPSPHGAIVLNGHIEILTGSHIDNIVHQSAVFVGEQHLVGDEMRLGSVSG